MPERTILVVDDDPVALKIFQLSLERAGLCVEKADSTERAIEIIQAKGPAAFQAIMTDYQLPGRSGLDFLEWVKEVDSALSVIIITSHGEGAIVHASMRQGATDFLEKPVSPTILVEAAKSACEKTIHNRKLITTQKNVRAVAQMNNFFKSILVPSVVPFIQLHYTPHDQVGGDFINVLPLNKDKHILLVGDVSGHDLRAGFVSAYFQGLVRGLCHEGRSILEVCIAFNDILTKEWQRRDASENVFKLEPRTTLSLLAVEIDTKTNRAMVVNCGAPPLKLGLLSGESQTVENANMPLGWSNEDSIKSTSVDLKDIAFLYLATDGLHEWSEKLGSGSLGLTYRLLQERSSPGGTPPDDLLVFRYQHAQKNKAEELWHPIAHTGGENPQEIAAALAKMLKNTLSKSPESKIIEAVLQHYTKPIVHCCVALRPQDGALKLVSRFADNTTLEVKI